MDKNNWQVLEEVAGNATAELIRSYLEANAITVILSQEGAGHFGFPVNVGRFGRVQILVPIQSLELAEQLMKDFRSTADIEEDDLTNQIEPEEDE